MTSFGIFKYMACYSLTQFLSVCLLYWISSNVADFQFLYIDLFLITVFAIFFGYTEAADELVRDPPPSRILSLSSVLSICLQMTVVAFFQVFIYSFVTFQPWYIPFVSPEGGDKNSYDFQVTAVFLQSIFQYIGMVVVYSRSAPYRKSILNNRYLTLAIVVCTLVSVGVTLYPPHFLADWLDLKMPLYMKFRGLILLLALINFVIAILCEKLIIDWFILHFCRRKGLYSEASVPQYRKLRYENSVSLR